METAASRLTSSRGQSHGPDLIVADLDRLAEAHNESVIRSMSSIEEIEKFLSGEWGDSTEG